MNYEPKIIEFIEGILSPEEERSFLYDMMENEESRKSFREILQIEKSFKRNFPRKNPSENLKKTVFASAGFSGTVPKNQNSAIRNGFIKSNLTYITHFLSAVAGVVIAGLLLFNDSVDRESGTSEKFSELTIEMKVPTQISAQSSIPKVDTQTGNFTVNKSGFTEKHKKAGSVNKEIVSNKRANISLLKPVSQQINLESNYDNSISYHEIDNLNHNRQLFIGHKSSLLRNIYFEFGGSESFFTQKARVEPANITSFINKSIGIFYKFNEFINMGISVNNENFYLDYRSDAFIENHYRVEQQPIILSGNLMLEFNKRWNYGIAPFLRINTGMSKTGPILGGSIGIDYNISDNIYLYGDFGYKVLYYKHEENDFSAEKYSINYGIKYHINN